MDVSWVIDNTFIYCTVLKQNNKQTYQESVHKIKYFLESREEVSTQRNTGTNPSWRPQGKNSTSPGGKTLYRVLWKTSSLKLWNLAYSLTEDYFEKENNERIGKSTKIV